MSETRRGTLLLNCDMGESFGAWTLGQDAQVMPLVDCANIACGFHAADPLTMSRSVELAKAHGVLIGAHPGYPDLVGFGRRSLRCSAEEVRALLLYQIGALDGICRRFDERVSYVKPHGALYNDMMRNPALLRSVMQAVRDYASDLPLIVQATADDSASRELADSLGLTLMFEGFADRGYDAEGYLLPREALGAVYHDPQAIIQQALRLARGETLSLPGGPTLDLRIDTLCVHGDNPGALDSLRLLRAALDAPA
ncbi:MAG: hypothetical protein GAK45_00359 [Pseudomonas citronellolis]|nr:MAG: hypothetical protein GAK45_00359 [Pseudomonas citronellolis]